MKFLIFQHISVEGLGYFEECFKKHGIDIDIHDFSKKDSDVTLKDHDSLWVLGGPMNTDQEEKFSWMRTEKNLIFEAVLKRKIPFMGICLGCQLLAETLGGNIRRMKRPEIGVANVTLLDKASSLFHNCPKTFKALHWHSYQATDLPDECDILAKSNLCDIQAFSYQDHAFGIQFHLEETKDTVESWCTVPEYKKSLEQALGSDGINYINKIVQNILPQSKEIAELIVKNFIKKIHK